MFCSNCGENLVEKSLFCHNCGAKIVASTEVASSKSKKKSKSATQVNCPLCDASGWVEGVACKSCGYLDDKNVIPEETISYKEQSNDESVVKVGGINQATLNAASLMINSKSSVAAFILTLFFGPFGMFYSTIIGGFLMLLVFFLSALMQPSTGENSFVSFFMFMLIYWPVCIVWGVIAVKMHNNKLLNRISKAA